MSLHSLDALDALITQNLRTRAPPDILNLHEKMMTAVRREVAEDRKMNESLQRKTLRAVIKVVLSFSHQSYIEMI